MIVKPKNTQVLLERYEPVEEKKKSKIIRLEVQKEREEIEKMPFFMGKVVGIGKLVKQTKVGEVILYEKHIPIKFIFNGKDYHIIKEEYITAYLEEEIKAEA